MTNEAERFTGKRDFTTSHHRPLTRTGCVKVFGVQYFQECHYRPDILPIVAYGVNA